MRSGDTAPDIEVIANGILNGDRALLARAITLVESTRRDHQESARALLQRLMPHTGKAHRIGVTGVPGVGKSTTIDQFGRNLISDGHRIAVLAVDPTSKRTGGSILGDKTRMTHLASDPNGFVRPSPTSGTLGGVTRKTRETLLLVEAAGYDIIIVETVGVGQSEVAVADMVDFFLVLLLPGGGDELQGIKKGIVEIADMIAINKADGDKVRLAERSAADYRNALALLTPTSPNWQPPVVTISGRDNVGLDVLWSKIDAHNQRLTATGELQQRRSLQSVRWMKDMLTERLMERITGDGAVADVMADAEQRVQCGELAPSVAVDAILAAVDGTSV
ncbi:MAG: methylmalonyl Co-A mutase-associated GTPase MeaB [Pseudomonadota bacterium]